VDNETRDCTNDAGVERRQWEQRRGNPPGVFFEAGSDGAGIVEMAEFGVAGEGRRCDRH